MKLFFTCSNTKRNCYCQIRQNIFLHCKYLVEIKFDLFGSKGIDSMILNFHVKCLFEHQHTFVHIFLPIFVVVQ